MTVSPTLMKGLCLDYPASLYKDARGRACSDIANRSLNCADQAALGYATPAEVTVLQARCFKAWYGTSQYGPHSNKMALITSDCGKMRSLGITWP